MDIDFIKCHGSGNSFVLVGDPRYKFAIDEAYLSDFSKNICSKNSVATDGLLIVQKDFINHNHSYMRMFNPDGSEAQMCGNGLRCVARKTMEVLGLNTVVVSTSSNEYKSSKEQDMANGVYTVSVAMGKPIFNPKEIPIKSNMKHIINEKLPELGNFAVSVLGMPNPHIVAIITDNDFPWNKLTEIGTLVNNKTTDILPDGGNVNFIKKISKNKFFVATYERGAGLTPSCGSGMSASSIIVCILKEANFSTDITIYNKGGFVKTKINKNPETNDYEAKLTGNATYILTGKISYSTKNSTPKLFAIKPSLSEVKAYETVIKSSSVIPL